MFSVIIGILSITSLLLFTSSSVIVPELSKLISSMSILYAFVVLSIFFAILSFSLSSLFELANIKSNPTITINIKTKYAGIIIKTLIIFFVSCLLKYITAFQIHATITTANIVYPHLCIVVSV